MKTKYFWLLKYNYFSWKIECLKTVVWFITQYFQKINTILKIIRFINWRSIQRVCGQILLRVSVIFYDCWDVRLNPNHEEFCTLKQATIWKHLWRATTLSRMTCCSWNRRAFRTLKVTRLALKCMYTPSKCLQYYGSLWEICFLIVML
jgi:hypothetical protein